MNGILLVVDWGYNLLALGLLSSGVRRNKAIINNTTIDWDIFSTLLGVLLRNNGRFMTHPPPTPGTLGREVNPINWHNLWSEVVKFLDHEWTESLAYFTPPTLSLTCSRMTHRNDHTFPENGTCYQFNPIHLHLITANSLAQEVH